MNQASCSPESTVAQLLAAHPGTVGALVRFGTHCIGCYLSRFCTLKDVVRAYGLDEAQFLRVLEEAAAPLSESYKE